MTFYIAEVIMALEYLHSKNIVYRDLKPENIIISIQGRGHIKLCDFGFAKRLNKEHKTKTNCGTPTFIAPEILFGKGHSFQVDIWALGVLIYEILTGINPFVGETPLKTYENITRCVYSKPKSLSSNILNLLE